LQITPFVPQKYGGNLVLKDFKYRNASIDIILHGFGSRIVSAEFDGSKVDTVSIPQNMSGKHTVEIYLDNKNSGGNINIVENHLPHNTSIERCE